MVGYGRSGDGVNGYTTPASPTIKRVGANVADAFYGQDDPGRPEANEVFRFDFDGPTGDGPLGGPTLGNTTETTLGPGDSGGPAFGPGNVLSGIATFTQGDAPKFASMGGGVNVFPYVAWINAVMTGAAAAFKPPSGTSRGGAGINIGAIAVRGLSAAGLAAGPARPSTPAWAADDSKDETASYPARSADEPSAAIEWLVSAPVAGDDLTGVGPVLAGSDLLTFSTGELPTAEE
jgi:hypothetical protein